MGLIKLCTLQRNNSNEASVYEIALALPISS